MNVRNKNKKVVDCVKKFATHCNFLFFNSERIQAL